MESPIAWLMFLIGLVLGWLLAWLFGGRGKKVLEARLAQTESDLNMRSTELTACRERTTSLQSDYEGRLRSLQADLERADGNLAQLQSDAENRINTLQADLQARDAELAAANARLAELASAPATRVVGIDLGAAAAPGGFGAKETDDFTKIKGIGPAFAARLAATGISSYADLAAADPAELEKAVDAREWQKVDTAAWVTEAKALAARPRQVQIGDDLTRLEGIGPAYATRLRAAGITTFAQLADTNEATLGEIIGAPAWRRVNYGDWIAQARLAAAGDEAGLKALQDELFSREGDNLELIEGLGATGVDALKKAGITSYAALAQATPEQLRKIYGDAGLRAGNFDAWIAEAKLRAAGKRVARPSTRSRTVRLPGATTQRSCPQDLEAIDGIGTIYEQRLYAVGIGTYWEVGMVPDTELVDVLEIKDFQGVDLAAIKADAMRLAAESGTMGQTWDGTEPDDFEPLEGIGPVMERRLYSAGICTFSALAAATEAQLAEICKAPAFARPNYGRWIEQARARLA